MRGKETASSSLSLSSPEVMTSGWKDGRMVDESIDGLARRKLAAEEALIEAEDAVDRVTP